MSQHLIDVAEGLRRRLEGAAGPDRDLDAEISWRLAPELPGDQGGVGVGRGKEPCLTGAQIFDGLFPNWRGRTDIVPAYTASLDSALSLAGGEARAALNYAIGLPPRAGAPLTAALAIGVVAYILERR